MSTSTARSLWRHADFLKLWSAQSISVFGSQVSALAIPFVAALVLHVEAFRFALLGTIEFLPFILFTLPAGAWVDRLRRRPILIIGDLGRAIALATIPLAYALGVLTIWQLYVVGFVTGTLTVFFDVANQSYLPSIVERDRLVEGNSKLQISQSAAQIAGPGIAGYLVGVVTAPFAILVDSLSFVLSAFFVFLIRRPEPPVFHPLDESGKPRGSIFREVREGLGFVLRNPALRAISAGTATSNLSGSIGFAIYLLYAVDPRELHLLEALRTLRLVHRLAVHRVPEPVPHRDRSEAEPDPLPDRLRPRGWLRPDGVQHQPGELPAGDLPPADAGTDERDRALHRLGHDPDRKHDRRDPRPDGRPAPDDLDRSDPVARAGSLSALVAGPERAGHAGADARGPARFDVRGGGGHGLACRALQRRSADPKPWTRTLPRPFSAAMLRS